jgi:hypothetical protein
MEVRISTIEIFLVHALCVLVRPMDFKPPITITMLAAYGAYSIAWSAKYTTL